MSAVPRLKDYRGPALLSYGFRPFFLLAAVFAGVAVPLWLGVFYGEIAVASGLAPRDWHIHEMLYGYVPAVVTGFLLTAIPNWTGRLPLQGTPLLVLVVAWAAGRVAMATSIWTEWWVAAAIDVLFLVLVVAAVVREIAAGRNWRNLKIAVLVGLLALANIAFHVEAQVQGAADYSIRLGLAVIILLIMVVGGRVIPNFTRNWLARERPRGRLPEPFGRLDVAAIAASLPGLVLWVALPEHALAGYALLAAGVVQALRLARWAGDRTFDESLVLVMHVGYAFIPAGFLLLGASVLGFVPAAAGTHAWAGAIAVMTLAIMTRASLGHTGQALTATAATRAIYVAAVVAAIARVGAAMIPDANELLLATAGLTWMAAFIGFAVAYGPLLCFASPRRGSA